MVSTRTTTELQVMNPAPTGAFAVIKTSRRCLEKALRWNVSVCLLSVCHLSRTSAWTEGMLVLSRLLAERLCLPYLIKARSQDRICTAVSSQIFVSVKAVEKRQDKCRTRDRTLTLFITVTRFAPAFSRREDGRKPGR